MWFSHHYGKDESPEGDLVRLLQNAEVVIGGDDLPTLGRFVSVLDPRPETQAALERAWTSWESAAAPAWPTAHPFAVFLRENYAHEEKTPLGSFAREFGPVLPSSGDRAALLAAVEAHAADEEAERVWQLSCFSVAWRQYQPTCVEPDCENAPCDDMSYCGVHVLNGKASRPVQWYVLIGAMEAYRRRTGMGLAHTWSLVHAGDYDAALASFRGTVAAADAPTNEQRRVFAFLGGAT